MYSRVQALLYFSFYFYLIFYLKNVRQAQREPVVGEAGLLFRASLVDLVLEGNLVCVCLFGRAFAQSTNPLIH